MDKLLNKRNGIIAGLAVLFLIIAIVATTSLSSAMNLDEAKEIAKKYVPESASFDGSEEEDRYFEVAFYDDVNKERFEVEVNKETGEVKKVESQLSNDLGSKNITLSEEDAKNVVKERFEGVKTVSVVLTKDNGLYEYEASFKADEFYGEADIHPETGVILDSMIKFGTVVTIPADDNQENGLLSYEQAKEAVLDEAGGGIVRDIDLDRENQEYFYEVELFLDGMERDYRVDAKSGEVYLENEHESYFEDDYEEYLGEDEEIIVDNVDNSNDNVDNSNVISAEEAKDIVKTKIPGAEIVEFSLEHDDGRYEYEGTAYLDGYEYEFEINGSSGIITSWDKEPIEDDEWDD